MPQANRVAIIGAGMAGMSCAEYLRDRGCMVQLFDKGRGPGGRMSTRRMEAGGKTYHFDHGAQYFTAREPLMTDRLRDWSKRGVVAPWPTNDPQSWVGQPGMNAPLRDMTKALDVQFGARVDRVEQRPQGFLPIAEGIAPEPFDSLVIAVPAEQAALLLEPLDAELAQLAVGVKSAPCWTVMAAFPQVLGLPQDSLRSAGPIAWAARNNSKPGRADDECWVLQASADWSQNHLEDDAPEVAQVLLAEFSALAGAPLPQPAALAAHRWRYALPAADPRDFVWDEERGLGLCGDWLRGARVEDAWMSGRLLAQAMMRRG